MTGRHLYASFPILLVLWLSGCSGPIAALHNFEGGEIAQPRQAPPGTNLPYPNLANVPPAPVLPPANEQEHIAERLTDVSPGISPASPAALAGLALPAAPPPLPNLPRGALAIPTSSAPAPLADLQKSAPASAPPNQSIALGFPTGSAILPSADQATITRLVAKRGNAILRAGGLGDGQSLPLAIERAERIANALTAAGVPAANVRIAAAKAGSGGFVELLY